ncbi:hypothetical protein OG21DRAFT_1514503 [Imleria badia]|nr:hypothetical protein OG21DRAFT_1514503 [Imleria badia]
MMNAWASSPSPSLDALSSESSSSTLLVGCHVASTFPRRLWDAYVTYLWYYQPNSWIGRVASTFRILAVVLVLPVVLLTLLDVSSYVIARTLGVVDDVKASTSDVDTTADGQHMDVAVAVPVSAHVPTDGSSHGPARGSEGLAPEDSVEGRTDGHGCGHGCGTEAAVRGVSTIVQAQTRGQGQMQQTRTHIQTPAGQDASEASPQAYYFAGEDNLRLAGEGVFSPAVSMPPSPLIPRFPLHTFTDNDGRESGHVSEEEGIVLRRRVHGALEDELVHT